MPFRLRLLGGVLVCACATTVGAAQQPGTPPAGPPLRPPTDNMSPAQLHDLFDAMLVMQAQNALSLGEQQYAQFLMRLRVLQQTRRKNQQERGRIISELQKMTNPRNPQAPESDVKVRLTELQELEARSAAELRRAYTGIDEVLTPVQQARFRVLEEQIERRKLELVAQARLNNQQKRQNPVRQPARRPPGSGR